MRGLIAVFELLDDARIRVSKLVEMDRVPGKVGDKLIVEILTLKSNVRKLIEKGVDGEYNDEDKS